MQKLIDTISQPWPWYVAGPLIAAIMLSFLLLGNRFGISSNLKSMCSILGAGKSCEYFDFDWKSQRWNLVFALGMILGGTISAVFLDSPEGVAVSEAVLAELDIMGVSRPDGNLVPVELFSWESLLSLKGFVMLIVGGFLIGFGTRYGSGCTSGHAISGLSELQLPSLIATIGFFIGGLLIVYLVLPFLLTL